MSKFEITIDVTYICHFNCPFCSTDMELSGIQMSYDVASACLHFMETIKQSNSREIIVVVSGGEPLLYDDLTQLLKLWNSMADDIILCSSGSVTKGQGYWNQLYYYGLKTVRLSLHGVLPDICRNLFGPGYSLSTVKRTISSINEAGLGLDLNFVINRETVKCLRDVFDFSAGNGVRKVRLLGLARQGRAKLNWDRLKVSKECEDAIIAEALDLSSLHKIEVEFAGLSGKHWCSHSDAAGNCLGGKTFFHITTNGDIYPCPGVKALPRFRMGSVMQHDQVKSILGNSERENKCLVSNEDKQLLREPESSRGGKF